MFSINSFYLSIFNFFDLVLLKSKLNYIFYSYTNTYYTNLAYILPKIKAFTVYFNEQMNTILTERWQFSTVRTLFYNSLFKFWKQFYIVSYAKIRYKGKGYKLYLKKENRIFFQFGLSHKWYVHDTNSHFFFLTKGKMLFLGLNKKIFYDFLFKLIRSRYLNIFTARGLRLSRQVVFKKVGKISAYR